MKTITLFQMVEQLKVNILDVQFDINSDWIGESDKRKMQSHLQNLIIAKANLELVLEDINGQIFNSSLQK